MAWICDICYSVMEATHVGPNLNRIYCPNCGSAWFVDDDDEYIGEDDDVKEIYDDDDNDDGNDEQALDVYDAALIWASRGKDEDYTFGYTEEELENAL